MRHCLKFSYPGKDMGATVGDLVPRVDGGVPQPLRVELGGGEPQPGGADHRVADGRRAGLQCKDDGGGDGGVRGADEGSRERD